MFPNLSVPLIVKVLEDSSAAHVNIIDEFNTLELLKTPPANDFEPAPPGLLDE